MIILSIEDIVKMLILSTPSIFLVCVPRQQYRDCVIWGLSLTPN